MKLGMRVGLGPGHIVLHGDPAHPLKGSQPPNFRPMSIVTKRSPTSATAEHLLLMYISIAKILPRRRLIIFEAQKLMGWGLGLLCPFNMAYRMSSA